MSPAPAPTERASLLFALPGRSEREEPLVWALRTGFDEVGVGVEALMLDAEASAEDLLERILRRATHTAGPLLLGGFSLGARLAVSAASFVQPVALLLFGFPFHRRGEPSQRPGLTALQDVVTPTLIVQGTRDAHGTQSEVRSYGALPGAIQIRWVEDGNHRFVPRARSGLDPAAQLAAAADAAVGFVQTVCGAPRGG
jgi:predicted alpha/beta-hydrolase family hydrolase